MAEADKEFHEKLILLIDEYVHGRGLSADVAIEIMEDEITELAGEMFLAVNPDPAQHQN